MKIGVLSDTHDRIETTREAIRLLTEQGAELLLHCGDIVSPSILHLFADLPTHFVFGNNDEPTELLDAIAAVGASHQDESGQLTLSGRRIAWVHGHHWHHLLALEQSGQFDYLFYGHTHVAESHRSGKTLVANPGALQRARVKTCLLVDLASGELRTIEVPAVSRARGQL
jgi:uncharacterized protein